ncbi:hypothetical protein DQ04_01991000 [Trypanosoma grayi]|uniref:hypothetical protein n=1 Tax=Trypanosoma grayi TaxID=71804 RepID=UPI0004F430DE|nr:hypothetical protein DQ04_01991000 [Trypanosoma grayi]KEG12111.1 hypothetical protein DQ04_01991000 [Trypanosoma grayi]
MISPSNLENRDLAVLIAVCTAVSYSVCLYWWRVVPRLFYPEEKKLEEQIAFFRCEAERYSNTDQLHLHGKLTRQAQQLVKELAHIRQRRFSICCCNYPSRLGKPSRCCILLRSFLARLKYAFPNIMGFIISFGFMIPVLYLYGNRPEVVVFPQCFRIDFPLMKAWLEPVVMSLLLGPLLCVSVNVNEVDGDRGMLLHSRTGNHASGSVTPLTAVTVNGDKEDTDAELRSLGVLPWFFACYVAVRLTHRVLSRH